MLEPECKLPWKISDFDGFTINLECNDGSIAVFNEYENQDKDRTYLIQACNNFPKATELLKQFSKKMTVEELMKVHNDTHNFLKSLK